ncbi:PD-(D/E)XK nuclease family transposase, partial [uncultured Bacteroides sp.]
TESELVTLFDKWLFAIRNLASLMERPQVLQDKVFGHLFEVAEIAKFNRKERYEYEESLKNYRDWFSVMETAEIRGLEKGMKKGIEQGIEQGIQQGIEQGIQQGIEQGIEQGVEQGRSEEKMGNASNLKKLGVSVEVISQATGLSKEIIEKL